MASGLFQPHVVPVERNMQHCDSMFGVEVNNMDMIHRKMAGCSSSGLADSDCCEVIVNE